MPGYTKGAVYSNLASKEDLFLAVLDASPHGSPTQRTWMTSWPSLRIASTGARSQPKEAQMAGVEIGDFGSPDETRTPDKTTIW
jgi:AcrR family transcriptional regulator